MSDQPAQEFVVSFRQAPDHDTAVQRAYRLIAEIAPALPQGSVYGLDNEEDDAPYIYVVHPDLTKESFAEIVDNAQRVVEEDETIVELVHKFAAMGELMCGMVEAGIPDDDLARHLARDPAVRSLASLLERFPYSGLADRLGTALLPRFSGLVEAIRRQKEISLTDEEAAKLEAYGKVADASSPTPDSDPDPVN